MVSVCEEDVPQNGIHNPEGIQVATWDILGPKDTCVETPYCKAPSRFIFVPGVYGMVDSQLS